MVWKVVKWIGFAILVVLGAAFVRRNYLDSLPTAAELEAGQDLFNAAADSAAQHNIARNKVFVVYEPPRGYIQVADHRIVDNVAATEFARVA